MSKTYFSAPGFYQIKVQGQLPPHWNDRFGAMEIFPTLKDAGRIVTILQGSVSDQTELSGILNSLYELQLSLLSVQYMGEKPPLSDATGS